MDPYELTRVREVMVNEVDVLDAGLSLPEAVKVIETGRHHAYPVIDAARRPVGMVSRGDALRWKTEGGHAEECLEEWISDAGLVVVHPDDVVARALDVMMATGQGASP